MSKIKVLQSNADFRFPPEALMKSAGPISDVPGLMWKVWIYDDEKGRGGGWYMFESEEALQAYMDSDIMKAFMNNPGVTNLDVKVFDVLEEPSLITRAPIGEIVPA